MPIKRHVLLEYDKKFVKVHRVSSTANFYSGFCMELSVAFHDHMRPLVQVLCTQLHPYFQTGHCFETTDSCSLKTLCFFEQYFSFFCAIIQRSLYTHKSLISRINLNKVFQIVNSLTTSNTLVLVLKVTAKFIFLSSAFNVEKHTERGSTSSSCYPYKSHHKYLRGQNFCNVTHWCYCGGGWHQTVDSQTSFIKRVKIQTFTKFDVFST